MVSSKRETLLQSILIKEPRGRGEGSVVSMPSSLDLAKVIRPE